MGPKRGRGAARKSQRGTCRGQVAGTPKSQAPPSAEDEAMLFSEQEQPERQPAGIDLADITASAHKKRKIAEKPKSPTPPSSEDEAMLNSEQEQPQCDPAGCDLADITASIRKKRKNKPYFYSTLTEAQKEEIIDWLKDNHFIYAKRLTDYKDSQKKEKLWEDKTADIGVEVADLKTFHKSNRTKMTRVKRTVGKSGEGSETVDNLSATDNWVWEKFSFIKDHIETVQLRNVVSLRGRGRVTPAPATAPGPAVHPPTEDIIQSDSGAESQSTEPTSGRISTESGDLKRSLVEFMSSKKGGSSTFARHTDEGLAQLSGYIKRATETKLIEVLHDGQRQAEERQEMLQQMSIFPQQQQQQFAPMQPIRPQLPSSTSRQYPPRSASQSHQWQPPPSQWSTQQMSGQQRTSVWASQDCHYMSSKSLARASTSSQGSTAAAADKTTDSLNMSDFLRTAMTTAGITNMAPSPVTLLGTPQPPPEDDDTTNM